MLRHQLALMEHVPLISWQRKALTVTIKCSAHLSHALHLAHESALLHALHTACSSGTV